jgi:hypothetical protein
MQPANTSSRSADDEEEDALGEGPQRLESKVDLRWCVHLQLFGLGKYPEFACLCFVGVIGVCAV